MRILLIEDQKKISQAIAKGLREESYLVDQIFDGIEGEHAAFMQEHDLIILDIMLPGLDGLSLCQHVREAKIATPILMLSARSEVEDRVSGLNQGADDYLAKPFEFDELLARVRALLRRYTPVFKNKLVHGKLMMDLQSHEVSYDHQTIQLTRLEYRLLEYLLQHQGMVLSRSQLAERVWGDLDISPGTVDVYMGYLRSKIDKVFDVQLFQTVRGIGYQLSKDKD